MNTSVEECRRDGHPVVKAETVARTPFGPVWRTGWDCPVCSTFHDDERDLIRRFLWWLCNGDRFWAGEVHFHGGNGR